MARVPMKIELGKIEQLDQAVGPGPDYMIGKIHCRILCQGRSVDTYATVKQVTGTSYSASDNIEVSPPVDYKGPMDYQRFSDAAASHYKQHVVSIDGSAPGAAIALGSGASVTMRG